MTPQRDRILARLSYRAQLAALYLLAAIVLAVCWWVAR